MLNYNGWNAGLPMSPPVKMILGFFGTFPVDNIGENHRKKFRKSIRETMSGGRRFYCLRRISSFASATLISYLGRSLR